jgi:hypothetical protein
MIHHLTHRPKPLFYDINQDSILKMIYSDGTSMKIKTGPSTKSYSMDKQIIAFSIGKIDDTRIVILVIFADWNIILFDSNFVQIWKTQKNNNPSTPPESVGIVIIPEKLYKTDTGMVVIGMKSDSVKSAYSYFAFDGKTGQLRWKHDSENSSENDKIKVKTNLKDRGEVNWRIYKSDVLSLLPHSYRTQHDMDFSVHHFIPESEKVSRRKRTVVSTENKKTYPNVLVAHLHDGIEVIHLFTGRKITGLGPLQRDLVYSDTNGNGIIDSVRAIAAPGTPEHCTGRIDSGIPTSQDLVFSTSICTTSDTFNKFRNFQEEDVSNVKLAPPVVSGSFMYFLASNGIVTGIQDGKILFQTSREWYSRRELLNQQLIAKRLLL